MAKQKKTVLLTGGTGDVGYTIAKKLLEQGHDVYLPMRSPEKDEAKELASLGGHISFCDLEDPQAVFEYLQQCAAQGVFFDYIFPFVGVFLFDNDEKFGSESKPKEEREKDSIAYHERGNVLTTQTVVYGSKKVFGERLKKTFLAIISSWAAHFAIDDPNRANQEGYVQSKLKLSLFGEALREENIFGSVLIDEPKFIKSKMTKRLFPLLYNDPHYPKITLEEYQQEFLTKTGLAA